MEKRTGRRLAFPDAGKNARKIFLAALFTVVLALAGELHGVETTGYAAEVYTNPTWKNVSSCERPESLGKYCFPKDPLPTAATTTLKASNYENETGKRINDLPNNAVVEKITFEMRRKKADGVSYDVKFVNHVIYLNKYWDPHFAETPVDNGDGSETATYVWDIGSFSGKTNKSEIYMMLDNVDGQFFGVFINMTKSGTADPSVDYLKITLKYDLLDVNTAQGGSIAAPNGTHMAAEKLVCNAGKYPASWAGKPYESAFPLYLKYRWKKPGNIKTNDLGPLNDADDGEDGLIAAQDQPIYNSEISSGTPKFGFNEGQTIICTVEPYIYYGLAATKTFDFGESEVGRVLIGGGEGMPVANAPLVTFPAGTAEAGLDEPLLACESGGSSYADGVKLTWRKRGSSEKWKYRIVFNKGFFGTWEYATSFDAGEVFYCQATPYKMYGEAEVLGAPADSANITISGSKKYVFTVGAPAVSTDPATVPASAHEDTAAMLCGAGTITNTYPTYPSLGIAKSVGAAKSSTHRWQRSVGLNWYSIGNLKDGPVWLYNHRVSGAANSPYIDFDMHDKFRCRYEPQMWYGGYDKYVEVEVPGYTEIQVVGYPPVIVSGPALSFTPNPPNAAYKNSTLVAGGVNAAQPAGEPAGQEVTSIGYNWYREGPGGDMPIATTMWYPGSPSEGDTLRCSEQALCSKGYYLKAKAFACDIDGCGSLGGFSNRIYVNNSRPSKPGTPLINPAVGNKSTKFYATATGSTDIDGDVLSYNYSWHINGSGTPDQNGLSDSYDCAARANCTPGSNLTVRRLAFDGQEWAYSDFSQPAKVNAGTVRLPPGKPKTPVISPPNGTKATNFVSSIGNATPTDGDPVAYTYLWYINGTLLDQNSTSRAYNCAARANCTPGSRLTVFVNATDADGSSLSNESSPAAGINMPPNRPQTPSITPYPNGTKKMSFNSSAGNATDPENDPIIEYRHLWYINGTLLDQNSTSRAYNCAARANCTPGSNLTVAVRARDAYGSSPESAQSAPALVLPRQPPEKPQKPSITPAGGYMTTTFSSSQGIASEQDGDPVNYRYLWYANSSSVFALDQNSTNRTYACLGSENCVVGTLLSVAVQASDSDGTSPVSELSEPVPILPLYYICPADNACSLGCKPLCGNGYYNPVSQQCCRDGPAGNRNYLCSLTSTCNGGSCVNNFEQ